MSTTSTKHEAALELAQLGYPVFPLPAGQKIPRKGSNGLLDATTDEAKIDAWWLENADYNIGIRTDGLLVVDIDGKENPLLSDSDKMLELAGAPSQTTPSGGRHYFFRQPDDGTFKNTQSNIICTCQNTYRFRQIIKPFNNLFLLHCPGTLMLDGFRDIEIT